MDEDLWVWLGKMLEEMHGFLGSEARVAVLFFRCCDRMFQEAKDAFGLLRHRDMGKHVAARVLQHGGPCPLTK